MTQRQFYDWQTAGGGGDVMRLVSILENLEIPWCMIGGLAVNHWAEEAMATADVDLVIATGQIDRCVDALVSAGFVAERFPWSVNLKGQSKVSIQVSTEDFYSGFPARSVPADVHGILMRVASREDTLSGKIKAWSETSRRASKRQKDLTDILRMVEAHPPLREHLPARILARLQED
jgi:hypothetical protein